MTPGTATWVSVKDRLPKPYVDVLILRDGPAVPLGGEQRVGRINRAGCWELASYQNCRWQYMADDVTHWLDVQVPLP